MVYTNCLHIVYTEIVDPSLHSEMKKMLGWSDAWVSRHMTLSKYIYINIVGINYYFYSDMTNMSVHHTRFVGKLDAERNHCSLPGLAADERFRR